MKLCVPVLILTLLATSCGDDDATRCMDVAECPAPSAACAMAVCNVTCGFVMIPGACESGLTCDPMVGCVGGLDAGVDVGVDVPVDVVRADVIGVDLESPVLRYPWNGFATGSVHVPLDATSSEHPLRPRFMWLPVEGAVEYEVQLDDSCSDRFCGFFTPEVSVRTVGEPVAGVLAFRPEPLVVSMSVPVGARYGWRVRACDDVGCGTWSRTRTLDVGRSSDDFNGDGWPDLAAGGFLSASIFYGDGTGGLEPVPQTLDNPGTGGGAGDLFGESLAAFDLNRDGFADLVVGDPLGDGVMDDMGAVYVYFGAAAGVPSTPDTTFSTPSMIRLSLFGAALAAGDVDGNGWGDVVIGAPQDDRGAPAEGNVFLFANSEDGFDGGTTIDSPANQSGSLFGDALTTAGDLDGDGLVDLVVGAPVQDSPVEDSGAVYVFWGSEDGIDGVVGAMLSGDGTIMSANLGVSVATGDADGDGRADLLAGASQFGSLLTTLPGNATLTLATDEGLEADGMRFPDPMPQGDAHHGASVALADADGDGRADVFVGAPLRDGTAPDNGAVTLALTSGTTGRVDDVDGTPMANFGEVLATLDVNADGFADVVSSAPRADLGVVFVFLGGSTPTAPDFTLRSATGMRLGRGLVRR